MKSTNNKNRTGSGSGWSLPASADSTNLLIVDDDKTFCEYVDALLTEKGYRVATESDPRRVMAQLRSHPYDIVLLDLVMPGLSGLDLLERIRAHFSVLPVLVVSGHGSAENTLEAMRCGATDFVTKPVDASHLDLRIRGACDLERAKQRANTDGLTGLYNHRHLHERLRQEIDRAERYGRPLSLVMADLDRFKVYNDTYGHPRGDELLIAVAQTLQQVSRGSDVVGRYGGDEFTIVLLETKTEEARVVAERARRNAVALDLMPAGATAPRVTLSLGVASLSTTCRDKEELIAAADAALYRAKRTGRDRVCVAELLQDEAELSTLGPASLSVS